MATAPESPQPTTLQPGPNVSNHDEPSTNVPSPTSAVQAEPNTSAVLTHHRDPSSIPSAAATLTASFTTDPVLRYVLSSRSSGTLLTSPPFLTRFFHAVTSLAITSSATITCISSSASPTPNHPSSPTAESYPCAGILAPPNHPVGGLTTYIQNMHLLLPTLIHAGWTRSYKLLISYPSLITPLKRLTFTSRTLKSDDFYYVFFLGTIPSARRKGLASAYVRWCQRQAREHVDAKTGQKEGKGVWLECSNEGARRVYEREGFEVVGEVWYGGGECDGEGRVGEDAKGDLTGAKVTGMVWWPDAGVRERYGNLAGK